MSKKSRVPGGIGVRNPVAQHAHKINRSIAFRDRTRYRRNPKHKRPEPFANYFSFDEKSLQKVSVSVC